jgi:hypothetical protein
VIPSPTVTKGWVPPRLFATEPEESQKQRNHAELLRGFAVSGSVGRNMASVPNASYNTAEMTTLSEYLRVVWFLGPLLLAHFRGVF